MSSQSVIRDLQSQVPLDGLLIVDKPAGWTSHDVVARVRRLTGIRRIGHAGTLDPLATGVLPLGIGQGTRVIEYLLGADKAYRATVRLGVSTDTDDAEGAVLAERDWRHLTEVRVREALAGFTGDVDQIPPSYSAIKRGGVPLYKLARAGKAVQAEPRRITVFAIDILQVALPDLTFEVSCSKGAYIRGLARDLGEALGCGAHLTALRRLRTGPFDLAQAHSLDELAGAAVSGDMAALVLPLDSALAATPALILSESSERRLQTGRTVKGADACAPDTIARVYSADGIFVALARRGRSGEWLPEKVFALPAA